MQSYKTYAAIREKFMEAMERAIHRFAHNFNVENCTGDHLENCKNCRHAFNSDNSEDAAYIYDSPGTNKDFMDDNCSGWGAELSYETLGNPAPYHCLGVISCGYPKHVYYSYMCHNCEHCFGCVSLRNKRYCIFNTQYEKQEYEATVAGLIAHMQHTGEWGEFPPVSISPFAYNETLAYEYFRLTKEEVSNKKWHWKDPDTKEYVQQKCILPDSISDVPDSIIDEICACEACGKNYRIINQELEFYRKLAIPAPRTGPDCRFRARNNLRTPAQLFKRACSQCGIGLFSAYSVQKRDAIYCEACYQKAVY